MPSFPLSPSVAITCNTTLPTLVSGTTNDTGLLERYPAHNESFGLTELHSKVYQRVSVPFTHVTALLEYLNLLPSVLSKTKNNCLNHSYSTNNRMCLAQY